MKKLSDYLDIHIHHEEDYMRSIGYTLLEEQRKTHKNINQFFNEWKKSFGEKSINVIEKELAYNIEKLIVHHIKYEDVKIREWCEERDVDPKGVAWKDYYLIGNELIDKERKNLFK